MPFFLLTLSVILNTIANLLLKVHSRTGFRIQDWRNIKFFSENYLFFVAIIVFAGNMLIYYFAIRHIPLSVAFPYMAGLSFLLISLFSQIFLREDFTVMHLVGYFFILVGISFIFLLGQKSGTS